MPDYALVVARVPPGTITIMTAVVLVLIVVAVVCALLGVMLVAGSRHKQDPKTEPSQDQEDSTGLTASARAPETDKPADASDNSGAHVPTEAQVPSAAAELLAGISVDTPVVVSAGRDTGTTDESDGVVAEPLVDSTPIHLTSTHQQKPSQEAAGPGWKPTPTPTDASHRMWRPAAAPKGGLHRKGAGDTSPPSNASTSTSVEQPNDTFMESIAAEPVRNFTPSRDVSSLLPQPEVGHEVVTPDTSAPDLTFQPVEKPGGPAVILPQRPTIAQDDGDEDVREHAPVRKGPSLTDAMASKLAATRKQRDVAKQAEQKAKLEAKALTEQEKRRKSEQRSGKRRGLLQSRIENLQTKRSHAAAKPDKRSQKLAHRLAEEERKLHEQMSRTEQEQQSAARRAAAAGAVGLEGSGLEWDSAADAHALSRSRIKLAAQRAADAAAEQSLVGLTHSPEAEGPGTDGPVMNPFAALLAAGGRQTDGVSSDEQPSATEPPEMVTEDILDLDTHVKDDTGPAALEFGPAFAAYGIPEGLPPRTVANA